MDGKELPFFLFTGEILDAEKSEASLSSELL
jgi:hypothetical protein